MRLRALHKKLNNTKYILYNEINKFLFLGRKEKNSSITEIGFLSSSSDEFNIIYKHELDDELTETIDKINELIDSKEVFEYLSGIDLIEEPISIYRIFENSVEKSITDTLDFPYITDSGVLTYKRGYFLTVDDAINSKINEYNESISNINGDISYLNSEIEKNEIKRESFYNQIDLLNKKRESF